ncbi:MAG: cation diffusion facilitator family transporter [Chloroflexota bacterium]|nr:cation diffusion facilitator family transporter [Chloroflexota bacterium]
MHDHHREANRLTLMGSQSLRINLILAATIMVVEVIGGFLSNSLALLSDAGHMLVDALALGLALFAITIARRPATASKTYGYHRVEIMAALVNGTALVVVSVAIFYEAYQRFSSPPDIKTPIMLGVAFIGLLANLAGMWLLSRVGHANLNIRAAFWHIAGDTLSSIGVIIGGLIIMFTGFTIVDPIIAVLIGIIILWGAVRVVEESLEILLESTPRHIDTTKVIGAITQIPGVREVHDVHIWTITSDMHALSAHLVIDDQMVSLSTEIVKKVTEELASHFNIGHTTLQLECETCPTGAVCFISKPEE